MRQLLLRVPEELHRRLSVRAARERRSVNAVANDVLAAAVDSDEADRRGRLRARATVLGMARPAAAPSVSAARRGRILETLRGAGPTIHELIDYERGRV